MNMCDESSSPQCAANAEPSSHGTMPLGSPTGRALKLHLGCGRTLLPGWVNVDQVPAEGVTVADLSRCRTEKLPYPADSVDEILASHLIEHLTDTLALMEELHRVAKPGCRAKFLLPYGESDDAWEDPTHVRPYYLGSFGYFGQPNYWRADYGYRGDWRVDTITLQVSREAFGKFGKERLVEAIRHYRNVATQMIVEMTAIKPARAPKRELQTSPNIVVKID